MSTDQLIPTAPLSAAMPAYSKLNKRRRITCRVCGVPFGYVPLSAIEIEANLQFLYALIRKRQAESQALQSINEEMQATDTNVHNIDIPSKIFRHFDQPCPSSELNPPESLDERSHLSLFLPDAINVRIVPRCNPLTAQESQVRQCLETDCAEAYHFKFVNDIFQTADTVNCANCGQCIGVRFEPYKPERSTQDSGDRSGQTSELPTGKHPDNSTQIQTAYEDESEFLGKPGLLLHTDTKAEGDWLSPAQTEGWITLSLEKVDVEPLFGLVGVEQFSIRYEGGEMSPSFYRCIEANALYSQNSATWMVPCRRTKTGRGEEVGVSEHGPVGWHSTYIDLEPVQRTVPHMIGHGDPVKATIRSLCPIYPFKKIPDNMASSDVIGNNSDLNLE